MIISKLDSTINESAKEWREKMTIKEMLEILSDKLKKGEDFPREIIPHLTPEIIQNLPDEIRTYVARNLFSPETLKHISLEDVLKKIGSDHLFDNATGLEAIELPELKAIGSDQLFGNAPGLEVIKLQELRAIGNEMPLGKAVDLKPIQMTDLRPTASEQHTSRRSR